MTGKNANTIRQRHLIWDLHQWAINSIRIEFFQYFIILLNIVFTFVDWVLILTFAIITQWD